MTSTWKNEPGAEFHIKGLPGKFKVTGGKYSGPNSTTEVEYKAPGKVFGFFHHLFIPDEFPGTPDFDGYYEANHLHFKPVEPKPELETGEAYVDAEGEIFICGRRPFCGTGFWNCDGVFFDYEDDVIVKPIRKLER